MITTMDYNKPYGGPLTNIRGGGRGGGGGGRDIFSPCPLGLRGGVKILMKGRGYLGEFNCVQG